MKVRKTICWCDTDGWNETVPLIIRIWQPPCGIAVGTALRKPGQSFADLEKLADDIMYVCKMQMKATGYSD